MIFKHNHQFNSPILFVSAALLLSSSMFASEIGYAVSETSDGKSHSSIINFNKIAIDFVNTLLAKVDSGDYVVTPIEELIFLKILDMIIQREIEKRDRLRKAFMYMRHGR